MHLAELKKKTPAELVNFAESLQIENASSLRKQDIMFAILKNLAAPTQAVIVAASKSKTFDNSLYVGTLKNNGVGISSFHDYASKVDPGLAGEVAKIKAGIIAGSIKVDSPSSFNK